MDQPSLYADDIVTWAEQQAAALRGLARRPELSNVLDWENVAEEIESVGRSQINAVEGLLLQVMVHLLKQISAPGSPAQRHWRSEILTFQTSAHRHFSRSMRRRIEIDEMWPAAMKIAGAELVAYGTFPHDARSTSKTSSGKPSMWILPSRASPMRSAEPDTRPFDSVTSQGGMVDNPAARYQIYR